MFMVLRKRLLNWLTQKYFIKIQMLLTIKSVPAVILAILESHIWVIFPGGKSKIGFLRSLYQHCLIISHVSRFISSSGTFGGLFQLTVAKYDPTQQILLITLNKVHVLLSPIFQPCFGQWKPFILINFTTKSRLLNYSTTRWTSLSRF